MRREQISKTRGENETVDFCVGSAHQITSQRNTPGRKWHVVSGGGDKDLAGPCQRPLTRDRPRRVQEHHDGTPPNYHVKSGTETQLICHPNGPQNEFAIFDTTLPLDFFDAESGWQLKFSSFELGRLMSVRANEIGAGVEGGKPTHVVTRRYVDGLQVNAANLELLMAPAGPVTIAQEAASDGKKKGQKPLGRPMQSADWMEFWLVILRLQKEGRLDRSKLEHKEAVLRIVQHELNFKGLSETTLRVPISVIWDKIMT